MNGNGFYSDSGTSGMPSKNINIDEDDALGSTAARLKARAPSINISDVGLLSLPLQTDNTKRAYQEACTRLVVAQALDDGMCPGNDLKWLTIRELMQRDFLDEFGHPSGSTDWRQPVSTYYRKPNDWQTIFRGTEFNDRQVICITGVKNINHQRNPRLYCSGIQITRGGIRIIEVLDLQKLELEDSIDSFSFITPIIFKRHDKPVMRLQVKPNAFGEYDNLVIEGIVAEPLGQTQNG